MDKYNKLILILFYRGKNLDEYLNLNHVRQKFKDVDIDREIYEN